MSPALIRLRDLLIRHETAYGRLPTYKEAAAVLGYTGDNAAAPVRRDMRRLAKLGVVRMNPRGTIPAVLL